MNSNFSKLSQEERELRLTALALGELAPAEAEETNQAIAGDAELARGYERLKQTVELVCETAAMDRRLSPEGMPLKLDDTRRKKLLETFQTPAPCAVKPRRRGNLWYVPMSAAAALVGLLVLVITLPSLSKAKARMRFTMLSPFGHRNRDRTTVELGSSSTMQRRVGELAARDFDADGLVTAGFRNSAPSQPADLAEKTPHGLSIALPIQTEGDEAARVQVGGQWKFSGNGRDTAWNSYGLGQPGDQPRQPLPQIAAKSENYRYSGDANDSGSSAPSDPASRPAVRGEVVFNPAPAPAVAVQAVDEFQEKTLDANGSLALHSVVLADNIVQQSEFPATAPAQLSKEITGRFGRLPEPAKGIASQEFVNQDPQAKRELLGKPAVSTMSGREAVVRANGVDYLVTDSDAQQTGLRDAKDLPARNLYLGSETVASKPVASTRPEEELKEQGMSVYSVNAVGYVNMALKPSYDLIANPENSDSAKETKPALQSTLTVVADPKRAAEARQWEAKRAGAGIAPTAGIGGGATYAQVSIAGGKGDGRGRESALKSDGGAIGGYGSQPAKPETQIGSGFIDSLSTAGELAASPQPRPSVRAKFMELNQDDSRALGFDLSFGNTVLNSQSLAADRAVRFENLEGFHIDRLVGDVGAAVRPADDGAVVFQNGAIAMVTNGLVGNNSWPEASPANQYFAINGSSWFGKDGKEKLPADAFGQTVDAFSIGQSQGAPRYSFRSKIIPNQSVGAAGEARPAARGFLDDNINTALISAGDQTVREVNGRFDFQFATPANEPQMSRQSGLARSLNEKTAVDHSGPVTFMKEALLGVDAAGLPIGGAEAKEKEIDQITLGYETAAAEDSLEKKNAPARPTAGKPLASSSSDGMQVNFTNFSMVVMSTNATAAAEVAVPMSIRGGLANPLSFVRTNAFTAGNAGTISGTQGSPGRFKSDFVTPGSMLVSAAAKDAGVEPEKRMPAKPSAPAPTPQPEVLTLDNAFSTFSLNVSDVSFKLAAASLEKGAMPEVANIRSEEFINAFDYRDPMPASGAPIAFAWERARYPFAHNRDVVRFSVKTAAQGREAGKPLNIVLLLDNSGSMERADRVRIIQESLRTLAAQLKPQDKISVVTFSRTARLWADGVTGAQAAEVANKIGTLTPEGGTNLEDALDLAYKTALRHYAATAVNRVVLLTDGAANLGNVEPKELKAKVEGFRKQGIALDCFGIGWEGFNDDLLEQLSRNGDGRYGFVNTPEEAASEFVGQLAGALRVAASDVKMQVEFNPRRVTAYRQIGYAKHQLTKEQFRDNKVDAAEIGSAESGNALYVIETNPNGEGPIATVRARFRIPQTSDYREHEWMVPFGSAVELEQSSPSLRLVASASAFSEWLAGSPFAGEVRTDRLLTVLSGVPETYGVDPRPKKLEWMIRQAKSISGK